jgi:hypothetical protein
LGSIATILANISRRQAKQPFSSHKVIIFHVSCGCAKPTRSPVNVLGLAADRLNILSRRGDNPLQIYAIRAWRTTREAALTWLFLLGIYDRLSPEAELIEPTGE